ncbi:MAG: hypothetical protein IJA06_05780, partial [Oscillospiraceae bacterium]|nr:hypothetical protein [Oscillospiraceae bacterium]
MKKFFLNKKLMTAVLSLSLCIVIGGIAVFAAFQSGLPGVEKIKEAFSGMEFNVPDIDFSEIRIPGTDKPEEEPTEEPERPEVDLNGDIVLEPLAPEEKLPEAENVFEGPIVYDFPERMMAITIKAGEDFCTEQGIGVADIEKSIDKALEDAKALSANTVFIETSWGEEVLYYSEKMPQA